MTKNTAALLPATTQGVERAAEILRRGGLVAFPTETVYGLGGDAGDDHATAAIFAAKGRPSFNPLIVHVPDAATAAEYVVFDERADILAQSFWPGPLTLVLPRRRDARLSLLVSAGLDSVAVRAPDHPLAQKLLRAAGRPIAAPSANRSGAVSPTTPQHVLESLGERIEAVLAGGRCAVGLESTVLDLTGALPTILRPGAVLAEDIAALIGPVATFGNSIGDDGADETGRPAQPKSPGQLLSHYAPAVPVRLEALSAKDDEGFLTFGPDQFSRGGRERLNLSPSGDLHEAAANLFAYLRRLDACDVAGIAVMPIPAVGLGLAINDRLRRAAGPRNP
jgi:L-threonylcarbamoyladenylate synthase